MTLLEATATLIDAARQLPENRHLVRAINRMERRLALLEHRKRARLGLKCPEDCIKCRAKRIWPRGLGRVSYG